MKKLFLATFLLTGALAAKAQITLTGATQNPVIGNSYVSINCDTTGLYPIPMAMDRGANHTWNYATLTTISTDTAVETTCAATPNCSLFLTSTTNASKTLSSSAYVYSIINNDSVSLTGYYNSSSDKVIFSNPMKTLKYPFTYLDSFVDAYSGSLTYMGFPTTQAGTITVVADGWGKLITPSGTDTGVLRVRGSQTFIDSVGVTGIPNITVQITTFQWYKLNYHSPLMSVTFTDQIAGPGSLHSKTVSYAKKYALGVSEVAGMNSSLDVYPNPATDEINVKFDASSENVRVSLMDVTGREVAVLSNSAVNGTKDIRYNTSSLAKGVYMVRLQSGAETITKKVVLQ